MFFVPGCIRPRAPENVPGYFRFIFIGVRIIHIDHSLVALTTDICHPISFVGFTSISCLNPYRSMAVSLQDISVSIHSQVSLPRHFGIRPMHILLSDLCMNFRKRRLHPEEHLSSPKPGFPDLTDNAKFLLSGFPSSSSAVHPSASNFHPEIPLFLWFTRALSTIGLQSVPFNRPTVLSTCGPAGD